MDVYLPEEGVHQQTQGVQPRLSDQQVTLMAPGNNSCWSRAIHQVHQQQRNHLRVEGLSIALRPPPLSSIILHPLFHHPPLSVFQPGLVGN